MDINELSISGPVLLQEKPRQELVSEAVYHLTYGADRIELEHAAAWLRAQDAEVPFVNDDGMLVISHYKDEDGYVTGERFHEFVMAPCFLRVNPLNGEVTAYNHDLSKDYTVVAQF